MWRPVCPGLVPNAHHLRFVGSGQKSLWGFLFFVLSVHVLLVINNIKQQVNKTLFCSLGNRFG